MADYRDFFNAFADGINPEGKRVEVVQGGRVIGDLPYGTAPHNIRSNSMMYDVRPHDFRMDDEGRLVAHSSLGGGDFDEIVGFRRRSDV